MSPTPSSHAPRCPPAAPGSTSARFVRSSFAPGCSKTIGTVSIPLSVFTETPNKAVTHYRDVIHNRKMKGKLKISAKFEEFSAAAKVRVTQCQPYPTPTTAAHSSIPLQAQAAAAQAAAAAAQREADAIRQRAAAEAAAKAHAEAMAAEQAAEARAAMEAEKARLQVRRNMGFC